MKLKDVFLNLGINLPSLFQNKIGNGQNTRFRQDNWLGGPPLCISFPRLYRLDSNPDCYVWERAPIVIQPPLSLTHVCSYALPPRLCYNWTWSRALYFTRELEEIRDLPNLLSQLWLSNEQDPWEFTVNASRKFTIKDIEKEDHVFVHCEMAVDIWKDVLNWWQIANTQIHNLHDAKQRSPIVTLRPCLTLGFLVELKFCVREKMGTKNGETEQTRNGYNHKDEWVNVTRKKRRDRVLDAPHPIKNLLGRKQTSDFDRVMREKRYGKVVDVYITFKKAKRDTRFGFVRFVNIEDIDSFERRLKGILIGNERLVINRAKFAKGENMSALHSNFPPLYSGEEDKNIRSRLEMCWISQAKKLYVLQNEWDIMHNNGLGDYNVKYIRGLSLLFEWSSKEVVNKSLEENGVWLQQWFKNIRMWDDDSHHIGRLDFDSQILLPDKCLVLTSSMNEVCQNVSITLNRKSYPIKISEERFNASSLISSPHPYPGENVMFEEEFVEPSMVVCEDVNSPGCLKLREKEDKKVMSALSPFPIYEAANSCSFGNEKGLNDEIIPKSMHANFGSSLIMNVGPSFL
ncbi:nucleotide-binding alpha-beta plait domain-containing protein [Tanacetum coccineum]